MKTQEKVLRIGLVREKGYLYYLDKGGDISRMPKNVYDILQKRPY